MELQEVNVNMEQRICYLLATSDAFADEIVGKYQKGLFESDYCESLANLCVKYHKKYNTAPKENLQSFFSNAVAIKKLSADRASEIQTLIQSFDTQVAPTDMDFEVSEALNYFEAQSIKLYSEEAQALIEQGRIDEAKTLLNERETFERSKVAGCDVYALNDDEIDEAVNDTYEQLIDLPDAVGKVMNNTLTRGGFVTFIARMKAGKTYWMLELAITARNQGRKVIFFSAGDMTIHQVMMRIWQRDAKTTANPYYIKNQRVPYLDCVRNQKGTCLDSDGDGTLMNDMNEVDPYFEDRPNYVPCTKCKDKCLDTKKYEKAVSYKRVQRPLLTTETVRNLRDKWVASGNKGVLHVEHAPSGTLTVAGRRARIAKICEKYGWDHPDVVIYDYAGLMASEKHDERESTHFVWRSMRAEADPEMFDCLVVTAMQANSSSFDFDDLSIRSFSLDKRCFDEVSAAYAINQTPEERRDGITRIAALLKREHPFNEEMQAECHGCLSLGRPVIVSDIVYRQAPKPKFTK